MIVGGRERLLALKQLGEPITMLTCYDFPTATMQDEAGIGVIFVGDRVGTNVLGQSSPELGLRIVATSVANRRPVLTQLDPPSPVIAAGLSSYIFHGGYRKGPNGPRVVQFTAQSATGGGTMATGFLQVPVSAARR